MKIVTLQLMEFVRLTGARRLRVSQSVYCSLVVESGVVDTFGWPPATFLGIPLTVKA